MPDKAMAFVEKHGTTLERARLRRILHGTLPEEGAIQSLAEVQNQDGGFPFNMVQGNLSTVDNTLTCLWWLDELGRLESSIAGRAFRFLLSRQQADGGWDEDPAIAQYDLPPWVHLGDLRTRLFLTAYAAYWLARGGGRAHPAWQKALDFLRLHQDERGRFRGFLHTTWIATSVMLMAGPRHIHAARKGLLALRDLPPAEWEDSQIAWALSCLGRAGLLRDHPLAAWGLSELLRRQRADGTWASEDGEDYTVGATIQALEALQHYGLIAQAA